MTSCISIWVKNLANVANAPGWVRREGATLGGHGRSLHNVFMLIGQYLWLFYLLYEKMPIYFICLHVLQIAQSRIHTERGKKYIYVHISTLDLNFQT